METNKLISKMRLLILKHDSDFDSMNWMDNKHKLHQLSLCSPAWLLFRGPPWYKLWLLWDLWSTELQSLRRLLSSCYMHPVSLLIQSSVSWNQCILHERENGPRQREHLVSGLEGNSETLLRSTFIFCSGSTEADETGHKLLTHTYTHSTAWWSSLPPTYHYSHASPLLKKMKPDWNRQIQNWGILFVIETWLFEVKCVVYFWSMEIFTNQLFIYPIFLSFLGDLL